MRLAAVSIVLLGFALVALVSQSHDNLANRPLVLQYSSDTSDV